MRRVAGLEVAINLAEAGWTLCLLLRGLDHCGYGLVTVRVQPIPSPFQASWSRLGGTQQWMVKCV